MIDLKFRRPRHATLGLAGDAMTMLSRRIEAGTDPARRRALNWFGAGAAALSLGACGGGADDAGTSAASGAADTGTSTGSGTSSGSDTSAGSSTGSSTSTGSTGSGSTGTTTTVDSCSTIPSETAGPYPADGTSASGSNRNALTLSGIVRNDIRTSLSGAGTTAAGIPLTVRLKLVNSGASCAALANRAIYLWHCNREGLYSLYSSGVSDLDYLRGVQVTDAAGEVSFTTVFPGCYSGRWPHIHFEIYDTLTAALDSSRVGDYEKVSQLALPADVCQQVYATTGYSASVGNLSRITLASDNVFGNDQAALQMANVTGSVSAGYVATLNVGISA